VLAVEILFLVAVEVLMLNINSHKESLAKIGMTATELLMKKKKKNVRKQS